MRQLTDAGGIREPAFLYRKGGGTDRFSQKPCVCARNALCLQKFSPVTDTQTQMWLKARKAAGFESQFIELRPVVPLDGQGGQSQLNLLVMTGRIFLPADRTSAQPRIDGLGLFQILLAPLDLEKPPDEQLNAPVITGRIDPAASGPGAQPCVDSQGLLQIARSPHELEMSAKRQFNLLVITRRVCAASGGLGA